MYIKKRKKQMKLMEFENPRKTLKN